jgi:hypothetical protein
MPTCLPGAWETLTHACCPTHQEANSVFVAPKPVAQLTLHCCCCDLKTGMWLAPHHMKTG